MAAGLDRHQQIDAILLDFSKAFDKVPHKRLATKLHHYGIRDKNLSWIKSFLADRNQQVVLDGKSSSPAPVTSGVPQGTVLGPLLFLVYINHLPSRATSSVRLFADDCLLYRVIKGHQDAERLQADLNQLQEWEKDWQMLFNTDKCEHIRITNKRNIIQTSYNIHGHTLKETTQAKYLGVTIDNKLSWNSHVDQVTKRANQTTAFLRRNLSRPKLKLCLFHLTLPTHQNSPYPNNFIAIFSCKIFFFYFQGKDLHSKCSSHAGWFKICISPFYCFI